MNSSLIADIHSHTLKTAKPSEADVYGLCLYTRGKNAGSLNERKYKQMVEVVDRWNYYTEHASANAKNFCWRHHSEDSPRWFAERADAILRVGFAKFIRSYNLNASAWGQHLKVLENLGLSRYC